MNVVFKSYYHLLVIFYYFYCDFCGTEVASFIFEL